MMPRFVISMLTSRPGRRPGRTTKPGRGRLAAAAVVGAGLALCSVVATAPSAQALTLYYGSEASGSAYYRTSNNIYNGSLRVSGQDSRCWEMQRKTSAGDWVTTGFHSGSQTGDSAHIVNCPLYFADTTWHIVNPAAVYGLRMIEPHTGHQRTFCTTQPLCLTLR
jgi:hypothetical protein